jgi:hypothetical protein
MLPSGRRQAHAVPPDGDRVEMKACPEINLAA